MATQQKPRRAAQQRATKALARHNRMLRRERMIPFVPSEGNCVSCDALLWSGGPPSAAELPLTCPDCGTANDPTAPGESE